MEAKLPPRLGIVILVGVSTAFATNHIGARIAFDHGATVALGVGVRAAACALALLLAMPLLGVSLSVPRGLRAKALAAALLVTVQSYCLYSAVALIPPALALLVFQTSPMLYVLLNWATGKEPPRAKALLPMGLALVGLAFALKLAGGDLAGQWQSLGAGILWASASAACMALVIYMNANALKSMDGRLRTLVVTSVTAVLVFAAGGAAGTLALPTGAAGWAGLAVLAFFYSVAMITLFMMIPRVPATSTVALNFEPIALLLLAWLFLGNTVTPLQLVGAFLTVSAIVWLGAAKH